LLSKRRGVWGEVKKRQVKSLSFSGEFYKIGINMRKGEGFRVRIRGGKGTLHQ